MTLAWSNGSRFGSATQGSTEGLTKGGAERDAVKIGFSPDARSPAARLDIPLPTAMFFSVVDNGG